MKQFEVVVEQPAWEDIEHYYQRAVDAGAGRAAARWYNRLVAAILGLEVAADARCLIPEQDEFSERLHQLVFERRYRVIYTIVGQRVHVLCVRGSGMRELRPGDLVLPDQPTD